MKKDCILVGISGASGSGKTLVAQTLYNSLGSGKAVYLQEDSYYKDLAHLPVEGRTHINFDHPNAFDHQLLIKHIKDLLQGKAIEYPIYDYTTHTRKRETLKIEPNKVIILDGILILSIKEIREIVDIKIYVDTPPDICLIRRLQRDIKERGRSLDSVVRQYQETVRPMFLQFIEPSKRFADIIITHGGENKAAIDIVQSKLENFIK